MLCRAKKSIQLQEDAGMRTRRNLDIGGIRTGPFAPGLLGASALSESPAVKARTLLVMSSSGFYNPSIPAFGSVVSFICVPGDQRRACGLSVLEKDRFQFPFHL